MNEMPNNMEKCLEKIPSRFALATVATKRWEQLMQGGRPMVETGTPRAMDTVFQEIETGKLALDMNERKIEKLGTPIPLPPEPPPEAPDLPTDDSGEAA
jgi:DNA-directed RNA polymerase omega subunit